MWAYLVQGLSYGLAAAAQPGPFQAFVIAQTVRQGWRRALPISLAPLLSDGPIIALVLLVLSRVPDWLVSALYLAGGLLILYLAWRAFQSWRAFRDRPAHDEAAPQTLLQAALMNALGPGPYLFWTTTGGPLLIRGWREAPSRGASFLIGFYLAMVGVLVGMILLFGRARQLGTRAAHALLGVSALLLAGFGIYQVWRGLSALALPGA